MPKTRLNRDKRDVLGHLAAKAVEATPIEPAIEKRVRVAQATYDDVHARYVAEVLAIVARKVPVAEVKTLAKYKMTTQAKRVLFVNLDNQDHFAVELFNKRKWNRENSPVASYDYEAMSRRRRLQQEAEEGATLELPFNFNYKASWRAGSNNVENNALEASGKLVALKHKAKEATEELELAERADADKREAIKRDFVALIEGSRTFEDVIEVWPEAKEVTDQVVGAGRAISLVSLEAIERIRVNMQSRNVKA